MRKLPNHEPELWRLIYTETRESVVELLRGRGLLLREYVCGECGVTVALPSCQPHESIKPDMRVTCTCGKTYTYKAGSIFEELPGVDFVKTLMLLFKFAQKENPGRAGPNSGVSVTTTRKFFDVIRVRYLRLHNTLHQRKLGGVRPLDARSRRVVVERIDGHNFCRQQVPCDESECC
jgi:hypothetical protein